MWDLQLGNHLFNSLMRPSDLHLSSDHSTPQSSSRMSLHGNPTILVICPYSQIQLAMRKKVVGSVEVCVGKKLRLFTSQSIISDAFLISNLSDNFLRMVRQYEKDRFDLAAETESLRELDHPRPTHGLNGEGVVSGHYLTDPSFPQGKLTEPR